MFHLKPNPSPAWFVGAVFSAADPLIFRWYLAPPLPFLFLSIFLGLESLLGLFRPAEGGPKRVRGLLFGALVAGALILSLRDWTSAPDHGPARPAPEMAFIRLELLYRQVAEDLQARILPGYTIAAGDVGVLGYFLDARILDTVGLNSPEAIRYYPLPELMYTILYAMPPDLILSARPEIVVLLEVYGRTGLLEGFPFFGRIPEVRRVPDRSVRQQLLVGVLPEGFAVRGFPGRAFFSGRWGKVLAVGIPAAAYLGFLLSTLPVRSVPSR